MIVSLTTIEVEAFKNFVSPTTLRLSDLPVGLHFVRGVNRANDRLGSNGSGKSTFFSDAVTWCLYGRTVSGLRTTDVKSWLTKRPPRVAVTIGSEGSEHVVQRGPRASDLTIDGRQVGQEDVDALVGVSHAAFAQAVTWGQAQPLFLDLTPRDKMGLLQDALGLERWERRAEAASARERRLRASLVATQGEIRGLEAAEEHAQAALVEAREAAQQWGAAHARRLAEMRDQVRSLSAQHEQGEALRASEDLAVESEAMHVRTLAPAVDANRTKIRRLEGICREAEFALEMARRTLNELVAQRAALTETGTCPTCGQAVAENDAARHVAEIQSACEDAETTIEEARARHHEASDKLNTLRDRAADDEASLREHQDAQREHERALRRLERDVAEARTRMIAAQDALIRAEEEDNPHRDAAAQARARLRDVRQEIKEKGAHAEKLEASAERAQFWAKGFRAIRLMIVDDVLEDLRDTTAAVLEDLGLGEWAIEYATERETKSGTMQQALTAVIRSPMSEEAVRWEVYSGGERQRLRLAGALALSEVLLAHAGVGLDFRVMDEPTRGLSREGVRDLCEMLARYAEEAGLRLFYIDHSSEDGLAFSSTITVVGDVDGAHLEA